MNQAPSSSAFTWADAQAGARSLSPTSDPGHMLVGALIAADAAVVLLSSAGAWMLRHGFGPFPLEAASISLLAAALTFNAMRAAGAYRRDMAASAAVQIGRALHGWSIVFVCLVLVAYLTKTSDDFSRAWAIGWYTLALIGFAANRCLAANRVRHWLRRGRLARTVAIVDLAGGSTRLVRQIVRDGAGQVRLVGVFGPQRSPDRKNGLSDLIALSRLFRIDEVIVAVSGRGREDAQGDLLTGDAPSGADIDSVLRKLGTIPTNVRLCPELPPLSVAPLEAGMMFGQAMLTICHRPLTGWNRVTKRAEDLVLGTVALIVLAPVMVLAAIAIKLDSPGPVLFRQPRLGFNNNVIVIYKFRSMAHGRPGEADVPQARRHDPRVTRVGRFLRRSSIDELPQVFNVLKGEMSLVGPRPHALAHNEQYAALIDDYLGRHRVQPGITGWAQVNGFRGETDTLEKMQRRVEHDVAYIDNWSLLLDIRIMVLTVLRSMFDRNAY